MRNNSNDVEMEEDESASTSHSQNLPVERQKQLTRQLRSMISDVQRNRHEYQSAKLQESLCRSNEIFHVVKDLCNPVALESTLLTQYSNVGKNWAHNIKTDTVVFIPTEFVEKLRVVVNGGDDPTVSAKNWEKFGKSVQKYFKKSPPLHPLYGAFVRGDPVARPQKDRQRKAPDDEQRKPTAPKEVRNFSELKGLEMTTQHVEKIMKILQREYHRRSNTPICFFHFVIHPDSYSITVENIFYTSFLVRDRHAEIRLENNLPVIAPLDGDDRSQNATGGNQLALTITQAQWKALVKTFKIRKPMIPRD